MASDFSVDDEHFISTIDFLPTVLAAAGLKPLEGMDGRSFLPVLRGEQQAGRERVYTRFHQTSAGNNYAMRSVIDGKFGYIYNGWSNGQTVFRNESQSGRTFKAMTAAAADNGEIAERVKLFSYRVPEELFNYQTDPDALHNLANDPFYEKELIRLRAELLEHLEATEDPALGQFKRRFGK